MLTCWLNVLPALQEPLMLASETHWDLVGVKPSMAAPRIYCWRPSSSLWATESAIVLWARFHQYQYHYQYQIESQGICFVQPIKTREQTHVRLVFNRKGWCTQMWMQMCNIWRNVVFGERKICLGGQWRPFDKQGWSWRLQPGSLFYAIITITSTWPWSSLWPVHNKYFGK